MALNEVEILSSLSHPNIIGYGGSFELNGALMIEMEYADGGTLAQMLSNQEHNLPERQILNLFQQISSAIIHMHENSILHRDLKTANVFLNSDGFVKIGDFGISKILTTHAQARTVLGTPYYISPEMCEGKDYDEKSDIWAMGCILYEMCCLQRTFQASSLPALVNKIMKGNVKPIPDGYSIKLKKLVRTLLDKNPENRPSAKDVHDIWIPDILQFLENKGFVYVERKIKNQMKNLTVVDNKTERSILYDLRYLENDNIKIEPIKLPAKLKIKQVAVGFNHTLVTSEDGLTYSWGFNNKGQLGQGFTSECENVPNIIETIKSKHISKIVAGMDFSLFLDENGAIYSCGNGSYGCLGHGKWDDCNYPKEILSLSSMIILDVNCGSNHVIALSDQYEILVWGGNEKGQLGMGNYKTSNIPTLIFESEKKIHNIFCGYDTNIFTDVSKTKIWCCGSNENNKLAVDSSIYKDKYNKYIQIKNIKGFVEYCSIGINHCIYVVKLRKRKVIYLGGKYFNDQTHNTRLIEVDQINIDNIMNIKCGPTYSVFGTKENVIMAWGFVEHENCKLNDYDKKSNQSSGIWSQNSQTEQMEDFSGYKKSKVKMHNPTIILALYSSEKQINLGNILQLENVYPSKSNIFILCKTSAGFITRNKSELNKKEMRNMLDEPFKQLPKWVNDEIAISKYPWNN